MMDSSTVPDNQTDAAAPHDDARLPLFNEVVLNFIPSWFAVTMGTGVVSTLLHTAPHQFRGQKEIAAAFYALNILLFVTFSVMSVLRYTMYPWVLSRMIRTPTICMFCGTLPMGLATIIDATVLIAAPAAGPWLATLVLVLWWLDVFLSVLSCFGIPFVMFHVHELTLDKMTAVWLLPIVPPVVAAGSGALVATLLNPSCALIVVAISYMLWGVGIGLSFIVLALYFHRLAVHNLPNSEVIVSAFLPLGPLGKGAAVLLQLALVGNHAFPAMVSADPQLASTIVQVVSVMVGLMMWGFGLWWLMHGVTSLCARFFFGGLEFSLAFWGLIFPLGVYTAATIGLASVVPSVFMSWLAEVFIIILVVLWVAVSAGTVRNAINRTLFVAPCAHMGPIGDAHGYSKHVHSAQPALPV